MQVRDVMTRKVISVTVGDLILAAARLMLQNRIMNVVVKSGIAELWGTILDEHERKACIVAAENVAGVKEVHDHLVWIEPISGVAIPSAEDQARQSERTMIE